MPRRILRAIAPCVVALAPVAAMADTCALTDSLARLAQAQAALIHAGREGPLSPTSPEVMALRRERAALARMDWGAAFAGTDLQNDTQRLREHLASAAVLDHAIASGSTIGLRQHLNRPTTLGVVDNLSRTLRDFDCETGESRGPLLGDLGVPLLPSGKAGAAWASLSALAVLSVLWFFYMLRARSEALHRRYLVSLSGQLRAGGASGAVRVGNISRFGAQITLPPDFDPPLGESVVLALGDHLVPGQIAWRRQANAGLVFDRRIGGETFRAITGQAEPQRPGRIGRHAENTRT